MTAKTTPPRSRSSPRRLLALAGVALVAAIAVVTARWLAATNGEEDEPRAPAARAERAGDARGDALPAPGAPRVEAGAEPRAAVPLTPPAPLGPNQIFGRVVDAATENPVAAFLVDVLPHADTPPLERLQEPHRVGRGVPFTVPGGVFRIGQPPGRYDLVVRAAGYLPAVLEDVRVPGGDLNPLRVALERGPSIAGTVRGASGRLEEDIPVFLTPTLLAPGAAPPSVTVTRTASDGSYRFSPLPPGEYTVTLLEPDNPVDRLLSLHVGTGETRADLLLAPRHQVVLRVRDTSNRPVPQAAVEVSGPGFASATTSGEGQAVLRHLLGGSYRLRIEHPAYEVYDKELFLSGPSGESMYWPLLVRAPR